MVLVFMEHILIYFFWVRVLTVSKKRYASDCFMTLLIFISHIIMSHLIFSNLNWLGVSDIKAANLKLPRHLKKKSQGDILLVQ